MKKFWLKMGAIAVTLLAIIGYQFSDSGKLPNLSNFAQGVTCTSAGNVVTVSAASGEQVVITFPEHNTRHGKRADSDFILRKTTVCDCKSYAAFFVSRFSKIPIYYKFC
jgi:hypothetical protein